jgi:hypothetical protein
MGIGYLWDWTLDIEVGFSRRIARRAVNDALPRTGISLSTLNGTRPGRLAAPGASG